MIYVTHGRNAVSKRPQTLRGQFLLPKRGALKSVSDRAFDDMTDKELETPRANSGLGVKAKLDTEPPKSQTLNVQRRSESLRRSESSVHVNTIDDSRPVSTVLS